MSTDNQNNSDSGTDPYTQSQSHRPEKQTLTLNPARPFPLSVCEFYQSAFSSACELQSGILLDNDNEYLHQYRVGLRRVHSIASTMKAFRKEVSHQNFILSLSVLIKETNPLRDLDVYLMKSALFYPLLSKKYHPGLDQFRADITRLRQEEFYRVTEWFASRHYQQSCDNIAQHIATLSATVEQEYRQENCARYGYKAINQHYNNVAEQADSIDTKSKDKAIHRLRIGCKKLRYLLEFYLPVLDSTKYQRQLRKLKSLQNCLGEFNDTSVQTHFLKAYLKQRQTTSPVHDAVSQLKNLNKNQHLKARKQLLDKIAVLSDKKTAKAFKHLIL